MHAGPGLTLGSWRGLGPTKTLHSYREYVVKDLIAALGAIRLEQLRHDHVAALMTGLEDAGRGAPTIRRMIAVLASALTDAVRQRRLTHNVAGHAPLPPEDRAERTPWTTEQAVTFLGHCHQRGDRLTDVYEIFIGTGSAAARCSRCGGPTSAWAFGCCSCTPSAAPCPT